MTPELQAAIRNTLQIYSSVVEDALKLQRQLPGDPKVRAMAIRIATRYYEQVVERHGHISGSANRSTVAHAKRWLEQATAPAVSAEVGPLEIAELMPPSVPIYEEQNEVIA